MYGIQFIHKCETYHLMLNLFLTPIPLERLKYSSRIEKFQPFFETQISYYQLPFIPLRRATSQVWKGKTWCIRDVDVLEMYFHGWVFFEMAQFEENFDFWT